MSNKVYEIITNKVIEALESGTAPWRVPWNTTTLAPQNVEGYRYRGTNIFLLAHARAAGGYPSPVWATFRQIEKREGRVKKGESGTLVVYFRLIEVDGEDKNGNAIKKKIPFLRFTKVWNIAQTEGMKLPKRLTEPRDEGEEHELVPEAEDVVKRYLDNGGPKLDTNGDRAFYTPNLDSVTVPPMSAYKEQDEYYSTLFHEFGHSTGHKDRLDRHTADDQFNFGSHSYGREELVAEMTATFLCAETDREAAFDNSTAYLNGWIKKIREDPKAIVWASGQAQKAADLILGREAPTYEKGDNDE